MELRPKETFLDDDRASTRELVLNVPMAHDTCAIIILSARMAVVAHIPNVSEESVDDAFRRIINKTGTSAFAEPGVPYSTYIIYPRETATRSQMRYIEQQLYKLHLPLTRNIPSQQQDTISFYTVRVELPREGGNARVTLLLSPPSSEPWDITQRAWTTSQWIYGGNSKCYMKLIHHHTESSDFPVEFCTKWQKIAPNGPIEYRDERGRPMSTEPVFDSLEHDR